MIARILVVDDEPDMLDLLRFNLTQAGYEVRTAANGTEGLRQAQRLLPDLVILDLMLPDVDGFTVCELLRRLPSTASIPVFMLTAMSGEIPRCHGFESGATEFLHKPIQTRDLLERVRSTLMQREPNPTLETAAMRKTVID
jgi:DNA-binding response OmpR family regulator